MNWTLPGCGDNSPRSDLHPTDHPLQGARGRAASAPPQRRDTLSRIPVGDLPAADSASSAGPDVPRYEVTVQGRGIAVPLESSLAVGFLRLVQVIARDPLEAQEHAVARVRSDWNVSAHAFRNRGGPPYLTVTAIGILSWWHRLLGAPKGYIFFSEEGVQMPTSPPQERADGA